MSSTRARPTSERRSCRRLPVFLRPYHVGILRAHGWEACPARIFDVSAAGVLVHLTRPVEVGDTLRLSFTLTGDTRDLLMVDAQVRHTEQVSERIWRAGCRIQTAAPEAEPILARFVDANLQRVAVPA